MPAKLTTEQFIENARSVHGDRYDYSRTVYTGAQKQVVITCREHGDFQQRPNDHVQSAAGCKECRKVKLSLQFSDSRDEFIRKARKVHGDRYVYDSVNYVNNSQHVLITCQAHGDVPIKPLAHLAGNGCRYCGRGLRNTQVFIAFARKIHGDTYDYSDAEYVRSSQPVVIRCRKHGSFSQNANSHLQGSGCPGCAEYGFYPTLPAYLYILADDTLVKVGITKNVTERVRQINASRGDSALTVLAQFHYIVGGDALSLERKILRTLRQTYNNPSHTFDGSSECFVGVDPDWLLALVDEYRRGTCLKKDLYLAPAQRSSG